MMSTLTYVPKEDGENKHVPAHRLKSRDFGYGVRPVPWHHGCSLAEFVLQDQRSKSIEMKHSQMGCLPA